MTCGALKVMSRAPGWVPNPMVFEPMLVPVPVQL
jgi:hypothetical protein